MLFLAIIEIRNIVFSIIKNVIWKKKSSMKKNDLTQCVEFVTIFSNRIDNKLRKYIIILKYELKTV